MVFFFQKVKSFLLFFCLIFSASYSVYSQSLNEINRLFKEFDDNNSVDFIQAEKTAIKTFNLCEQLDDKNKLFQSYLNLIKIHELKRDYKKARLNITKALKIEKLVTNKVLKIDLYNSIAYIEGIDLNNSDAFNYSEKAIELALISKDSIRLCKSFIIKGGLFIDQQELEEANKYLTKAQSIAKHNNLYNELSDVYLSLAEINYFKNKDTAVLYYNMALENALVANNKFKQAIIYADLGFLFVYFGETEKVIPFLKRALKLSEEVGSKFMKHNIYYTYGCYYDYEENYNLSIINHKTAIQEFGDYVSPIQLSNAYIMLSGALWHNGNYKEAYEYQDKYIVLNDSIFNVKKAKEFDNIRTQYEVEKKDSTIQLLEKENQIAETRKKWLASSAIFLSIALLGLFLFYKHKSKTQAIILLQEQELRKKETERLDKERELKEVKAYIDGQEKERNRLAKELHDGVGGKLASINLTLSHINSELNNEAIKDVNKNLSGSFRELRALSHSLSTNAFKDKSFETLLAELRTLYQNSNALDIEISIFPEDILEKLDSKIAHQLYRVLQELMTNISKHAMAKEVILSFNLHGDILIVMVEDDGCGFDIKEKQHGIGLKNIKERITIIEGLFKMDSYPQKGTQVIIELPFKTISASA